MTQYQETVTIELAAEPRHQTAMRACSMLNAETPPTFDVKDPASISKEVDLTDDEAKEALDLAFWGVFSAK
ncbi:hypothetical protein [Mesorhizobium sp. M0633]|uniref:hypothetical protein n=1 Tax=Mesorhizobium sp. M0633 TaxID=2956977 RepID=UPI003337FC61